MGSPGIVIPRTAWLTLIAVPLAIGCVPTPDSEVGPAFDENACDRFLVPTTMGLGWERLNHRISSWSLGLDHDACLARSLDVIHIGGDFSTGEALADDDPILHYAYAEVQTDRERVGVARTSIEALVGPEGTVSGELELDRADIHLSGYRSVTAVIEGYEFITDIEQPEEYPTNYKPAHGYTMRGFGAEVQVRDVDTEHITLDWTLTFAPGPAPDRPRLNAALEHAVVGAKLDVLLIGSTRVAVTTAEHGYSQEHPPPTPLEDQEIPHADVETQTLEVESLGSGDGFFGFAKFHFDMTFAGCSPVDRCDDDGVGANGTAEPGEYLREITVAVSQDEVFDDGARFLVDGYLSNASRFLANFPNAYDFSSTIVWVRSGEIESSGVLHETFVTGAESFPLGQP